MGYRQIKKIFLISLGGQGDYNSEREPIILILIKGNEISSLIYARQAADGNKDIGIKVNWKLEEIRILDRYKNQQKEVMENILEAINALGDMSKYREYVTNVQFNVIAVPIMVKEIRI